MQQDQLDALLTEYNDLVKSTFSRWRRVHAAIDPRIVLKRVLERTKQNFIPLYSEPAPPPEPEPEPEVKDVIPPGHRATGLRKARQDNAKGDA